MAIYDELRTACAKCDALAHATSVLFDDVPWGGEIDQQRLERLAHLVGATAEAAAAALLVVDRLGADLLNPTIAKDAEPGEW